MEEPGGIEAAAPRPGLSADLLGGRRQYPLILMARSGPRAVIPLDRVCRDHFTPLLPVTFVRKV